MSRRKPRWKIGSSNRRKEEGSDESVSKRYLVAAVRVFDALTRIRVTRGDENGTCEHTCVIASTTTGTAIHNEPLIFLMRQAKKIWTVMLTRPLRRGTAIHDQPGLMSASGSPHPLTRKCQALSVENIGLACLVGIANVVKVSAHELSKPR